jgi:hypothetical protein
MVTVAVRAAMPGFADVVNVTVPLFEPEAGVSVNHASELMALQSILDAMSNVAVLLAAALIAKVDTEADNMGIAVAPAWVIVTV